MDGQTWAKALVTAGVSLRTATGGVLRVFFLAGTIVASYAATASGDTLQDLEKEYWAWAVQNRSLSINNNNTPRVERPLGWLPDWSAASIAERRLALARFEERWKRLPSASWPVSRQVDYRLLGSALARDRYDIDLLRGWQRNPMFYIDHTIGAVRDLLIPLPPFDQARADDVVARFANIPRVVDQAKANLTDPRAPFARWALDQLRDIRGRLQTVIRELKPLVPAATAARLDPVAEPAIAALESYRAWLEQKLPGMAGEVAIGRDAFVYYLRNVALLPFSPEEMLALGHRERNQINAWLAIELQRNAALPPAPPAGDASVIAARAESGVRSIRAFLQDKGYLTIPEWVGNLRTVVMPAYLLPIAAGSMSDLTSESRRRQDAVYYLSPADTKSDFALDPRVMTSQVGIPGDYLLLVLAWDNPSVSRRHYFDHHSTGGIAVYAQQELLYRAGFFDDSPHAREVVLRRMEARPRKYEWDIQIAVGAWTFERGAQHYTPNPSITGDPGLTGSNLIGRLQVLDLLAEAKLRQGKSFDLRAFHDYLWRNATVPLSLLRWEYLGLRDQVDALDRAAEAAAASGR